MKSEELTNDASVSVQREARNHNKVVVASSGDDGMNWKRDTTWTDSHKTE
jgi:glucose-6-phosphate dehydrogenase assembly protein OpcA